MTGFHNVNRQKIVAYLRAGCKFTQRLGFELEHILLHAETGEPVSYSEPGGVRDILERLAPKYNRAMHEGDSIIGLARPREVITIEPAAQLEVSLGPYASVEDLERAYIAFRNDLDPILDEFGLVTPMLGYNPSRPALELELIPKQRYEFMTRYLGAESPMGICMMRGSSSLQVSIDFENEADAMRKIRIAEAITPILALITDNSPVFEGEERTSQLVRTRIWSGMNQDRVGMLPGSLKTGYTFGDYADYILSRGAILVPDVREESGWRYVGSATFDEVYADREMTEAEIEHAMSMVWPDVRLKRFIEIRPADAMPIEYSLAYAVLIRALFYSRRNLDVLESMLGSIDEGHIAQAKNALFRDGYGAVVYGRPCSFWVDLLLVLAQGALLPGEFMYLEPLISMTRYRFTLADIWPRLMEKRNAMPAASDDAPVIGVVPRYDFEWTGLAVSDGYLSGLLEVGAMPIVLPLTNDPAHIERMVAACDGFLIPGGQDIDPSRYGARREPHTMRSATSRDAMEEMLVKAVIEADKPLLGVCRGMQSLNVALGGTLEQDIHAKNPESRVRHVQERPFSAPAHRVDIVEGSRLAQIVGTTSLEVNTIHHQCVAELGEGLVVTAVSSEDSVVEGIELPSARFVLGVQWHPELMWREHAHSKELFRALVDEARG